MESKELELIEQLMHQHQELKTLMTEHRALEEELQKYQGKRFLTPVEEIEKKRIQKLKLAGKDRIEQILTEYQREHTDPKAGL
jgi:uncharacterized protein YdcH (DUF465 family)